MEGIRLTGQSGHSSNPALGNSALEGMLRVAEILRQLRSEFARDYRTDDFAVPEPTINLGHIHGGDSANRICGRCEMHIDVRLNPGMTVEAVRSAIRESICRGLKGSGLEIEFDALFDELFGECGNRIRPHELAALFREAGFEIEQQRVTQRAVTLVNCFVMGTIPDSMSGIFEALKEAVFVCVVLIPSLDPAALHAKSITIQTGRDLQTAGVIRHHGPGKASFSAGPRHRLDARGAQAARRWTPAGCAGATFQYHATGDSS